MGLNAYDQLWNYIYGVGTSVDTSSWNLLSNPDIIMISLNAKDSLNQSKLIFGNYNCSKFNCSPLLKKTCLCIIKPHIVLNSKFLIKFKKYL